MRTTFKLRVHDGRVQCPLQHASVDVEECLSCLSLAQVRSGSLSTGSIVCKPDMGSAAFGIDALRDWPLGLFSEPVRRR